MDMSHNNFDSRELDIMEVGLKDNHSILGIHMIGNECEINALGFMKPYDYYETDTKDRTSVHVKISPHLKFG